MDEANRIFPIKTAYCGKSCTNCSESSPGGNSASSLLKCTSCKLAHYCSKACQKADWPKHKIECKLLRYLKKHAYAKIPLPDDQRPAKAEAFLTWLPMLMETIDPEMKKNLPTPAQLETFDDTRFKNFVNFSRSCSICFRNEFTVDETDDQTATATDWKCCPDCHFGWCCGSNHWDQYSKDKHTPEICNLFKNSIGLELFHYKHVKRYNEFLLNIPEKGLTTILEDFPSSWDTYFRLRFIGIYPELLGMLPPKFFPASTFRLTQPVTCLSAMYKFGISHFRNKTELTVHVVGADYYEVPATCAWEEISHCLPNVRALTIQFIGPDSCKMIAPPVDEFPTDHVSSVCPECTRRGRQRLVGMYGYTYHDYVQKYDAHAKPDLIVAFNTGMHEEATESWKTSLKVMLDMKVPAFFTSYSKEEAVQDFALLQSLNANILQETVEQNPFAEDHMRIEIPTAAGGIDKFYANNMYGVLFYGKKA